MNVKIKWLFISVLSLLLMLNKNAFAQNSNVSFNVKKGVMTLNGKVFKSGGEFSIAEVEKVLGKADRVKEGYNTLYTYDNYGVVFFVGKEDKLVNEVQFNIKSNDTYDFVPKNNFTGKAKVEKTAMGAGTGLETVQKKLKKYVFVKSLLDDNSYRGEYNKIYVYARFSDDNKSVTKLSVGFKK